MLDSQTVVLRTCTVAVKDIRDVEHSIEITAETLYEAVATALAALQQDNWVGEISKGLTTVRVGQFVRELHAENSPYLWGYGRWSESVCRRDHGLRRKPVRHDDQGWLGG